MTTTTPTMPTTPTTTGRESGWHSFAAASQTPESFGRAIIAQALMGVANAPASERSKGVAQDITLSVRPVASRTLESSPLCVDICVGALGFEACIHVVVPETLVDILAL